MSAVPCNGCTACCEHDLLILHPECGDDPSQYETMAVLNPLTGQPALALKHKPEGGCIYLEAGKGCSIHDRAPAICKEFDCRRFAALFSKQERKALLKSGGASRSVLQAGFDRLHTLEKAA